MRERKNPTICFFCLTHDMSDMIHCFDLSSCVCMRMFVMMNELCPRMGRVYVCACVKTVHVYWFDTYFGGGCSVLNACNTNVDWNVWNVAQLWFQICFWLFIFDWFSFAINRKLKIYLKQHALLWLEMVTFDPSFYTIL